MRPHPGLPNGWFVSGNTAKAELAYQDVLTIWKDADFDLPVINQAKAEYAKLQQAKK